MSFILDALKKLDKKRPRGSVPDLLTVHGPMQGEPKKHSVLWTYLILSALLLNAGLLLVWLRPWQSVRPNAITQSVNMDAEKKPLPEADTTVLTTPLEQINILPQKQPAQSETYVNRKLIDKPIPMIDIKEEPEIFQTTKEQEPIIRRSLTRSQPQAETGDVSKQKILNNNDLPLSVRQALPKMTISGHIYSNEPGSRIVNINGQIIREGEVISKGLKLDEITSTGIILSYKGYRFRMRLF